MASSNSSALDFDDEFVNILFSRADTKPHPPGCPPGAPGHGHGGHGHHPPPQKEFYDSWYDTSNAPHADPILVAHDALRKIYPNHSIVTTSPFSTDVLSFPNAHFRPIEKSPLVTALFYIPVARSLGTVPGVLVDQIVYAGFEATWQEHEYIVYYLMFPSGFGSTAHYFVLHEGPEDVSRLLLLTIGAWQNDLHDEIWVFNQGFWSKNHSLWVEIQKADWDDVILKDEFKATLKKDVYGFFESREIYEELSIPWKRGLIMYGPPGNGKTISLKAIMKSCGDLGFSPLYVKSFQSWAGEEAAMAAVFGKARELSPCVIILEDLDSLINDQNRSFFLNQMDGLEGNDGLLIIGTTNHFDRLDPGLSTRPSRFDRKFKFDDPDEDERKLYAKYWQRKLAGNKEIDFPDSMVDDVAKETNRFSFAYLKEAFLSSLVIYAGLDKEGKPPFSTILFKQINELRQQLDKALAARIATPGGSRAAATLDQINATYEKFRGLLTMAEHSCLNPAALRARQQQQQQGPSYIQNNIRNTLDRLATDAYPAPQNRIFVTSPPTSGPGAGGPSGSDYSARMPQRPNHLQPRAL